MNKLKIVLGLIVIIICAGLCIKIFHKPDNNNEVIFWTLQMSDFSDYMNGVIKEFEKENPDIKIKWIDVPFSEGEKRTLASVLSDNPPDLINLNPDFSATLAQKGALYEIPQENALQFNQAIVNSLKYNGKLYSLPWYATSAVTIYNKKLIDKAGIQVPLTYEEAGKAAQIVKSKTGAYIFLPNITENDTMLKILNKYGFVTDRYYDFNYSVITEDCDKIVLDNFPIPVKSLLTGIDKSVRDRFDAGKDYFNEKELMYDRTLRNFSYMFELRAGKGKLLVCGLNLTGLDKNEPSSAAAADFILHYLYSEDFCPADEIALNVLEKYLKDCAKRPVKERMMTQFWQLDEAPVESKEYWKESQRYLLEKEE